MEVVLVERARWCGAEPEVVVHSGGRRRIRGHADRIALAIHDGLARVDLPQPAIPQELHRPAQHEAAATLRADRDDPAVPARRLDHAAAFSDVVADRLLDVDVLARLTRVNRHQRMPVIGSGNGDRVDCRILEDAPEVGCRLWRPSPFLLREAERRLEMALVDVHDMGDAHVPDAGEMLVVIEPAAARGPRRMALVVAAQPDDGDVDRVVRARLGQTA
jgi:hypothetical protein